MEERLNDSRDIDLDAMLPPDREYTRFEAAFAWISVLLGYFFCRAFPFSEYRLGIFITVLLCIGAGVVALYRKGVKPCGRACFSLVSSVVFAFSFIASTDSLSLLISLFGSVSAYCFFVYTATGNRLEGGDFILLDMLRAMRGFDGNAAKDAIRIMFSGKKGALRSMLKIGIGLACAIIPTTVVVALLSFDGRFSAILGSIGRFFGEISLISHIFSLIFGFVIALYLFGVYKLNTEKRRDDRREGYLKTVESLRFVPALTVGAALAPLVAVYIIFFVSQWEYYLSGFSGVLPEGVHNYAEYARSGFFELCAVSGVNFCILIGVGMMMRRRGNADRLFLRIVNLLLSVMTLVLIGTAMSKMALYIDVYGLTEKRLLSSWLMVLLAILFIIIIIAQFASKIKLVTASVAAVCIACSVLSICDYRSMIANYNVDKYISGDIENIDVHELYLLGESSIPARVRLSKHFGTHPADPYYAKGWLINDLESEREKMKEEHGVFEFSIPRYKARRAIEDYLGDLG
ncbi:MAG: DUF4173 domain-containing protein [Clostridia bacterium]|nr:DUF4173 domain-containing protein [Clostridia bacterium]